MKTIEDKHFINSFWDYLYKNLGLSKNSRHFTQTAYRNSEKELINYYSKKALIYFDTPAIIKKDWIKRKTLEVMSEFLQNVYQFNIQQNNDEFILHRVVTNPINLEHFPENYSVKLEMLEEQCRITIRDIDL